MSATMDPADGAYVASAARVDGPPAILLDKVNKWYGAMHVLRDINLKVERGEKLVICGPSGSGKSTMIRCINRLEEHQKGQIIVDGTELTNDLKKIDEIRRDVGMVFQHFNLFPHLTILENLTLAPIWVKKLPKKDAEEIAMHYLKRVKIPEQAAKYPTKGPEHIVQAPRSQGKSYAQELMRAYERYEALFPDKTLQPKPKTSCLWLTIARFGSRLSG